MNNSEMNQDSRELVVGVGASAGGFEAFRDLFARLSANEKLAIILVQHLDPDHRSLLQELLTKRTSTPVHTAEEGMRVESGNIYLIPPGASLTIKDRELHLADFDSPRGQRRPIDTFFRSLAEDQGEDCVGIILSGTGSDGSDGIKAIKEAGGLVLAQNPTEASYDGMPKSAIASGAVDLTLTIAEMADVLRDYRQRRTGIGPTIDNNYEFVSRVFKHVRYHTGHDFSDYKQSTLLRRLAVRMSALGTVSPSQYLEKLIQDRQEAVKLQRDVLINVTGFFRDPDAFETLKTHVIPSIVRGKGKSDEVRVWVPGCSTGEEAYSIGMLIAAELERSDGKPLVTIFGTDIDDEALQVARAGQYGNIAAEKIPEDLLQRYMQPTQAGFEVGKKLRSLVRFSEHSLIKDPPFSKLDLISCRNLLIYFEKPLQEHAFKVFHYSLKPGRYLFLGTSETPQSVHPGFSDFSTAHHIYERDGRPSEPLSLPLSPIGLNRRLDTHGDQSSGYSRQSSDAVRDAILERHSPPFIATAPGGTVTRLSPGAEKFCKLRSGDMQVTLSNLIHPSLESTIRRLNNQATERDGEVSSASFTGEIDGEALDLEVTSERLSTGERFFVFHQKGDEIPSVDRTLAASSGDESEYVRELEQELDDARQTVRTTIEELETSNEELKSSNEEMMSMNEELQSSNEELSTINEELQAKISELNELNADLNGFVASTSLATVFLDDKLAVKRYTEESLKYFRFVEADIGRPLDDIASIFPVGALAPLCKSVLDTGEMIETDLKSFDEEFEFILRAAASRDSDDSDLGVIFTLIDVTEMRRNARELDVAKLEAQQRLAEVNELYRVSPVAMALFGPDLTYIRANKGLAEINGIPIEDHFGKRIDEIVPELGQTVIEPVRKVFETGKAILNQEVVGRTPANPDRDLTWIVDWYPLHVAGDVAAVGVNVRDVTAYKEVQEELRRVMLELQHRVKNMLANVAALVNRARLEEGDAEQVLHTLFNRITALGKTHQLLTQENWHSATFRELIEPELTRVYGDDIVSLRGPSIRCNSKATLALGMAVHELATNAAKYGCLAQPDGKLDVSWSRTDEGDGEVFRMNWQETCPEQIEPPTREGFGSTLIKSTIERTLDGNVELFWEPSGLRCVITVPSESITEFDEDISGKLF
ncbi:PAS domain-containing protein [Parvularcula sp. ZS-1/3]|uniref:PAS domain-containing protein n=1 Tax=Parvularcula mediterranea TaxID=2732508 RepID=A0A7Y3W5G0_9PROT|nr:chemotaxis protein CheB [Parvularcula mediterranea]NNU16236.1 PAS domain-containing protein [Parvularcula mediterranea]